MAGSKYSILTTGLPKGIVSDEPTQSTPRRVQKSRDRRTKPPSGGKPRPPFRQK